MDDLFDSRDSGAIDLARRLEAFAEARLTPSVASTTALRGAVMAAAHRRAALLAAEAAAQAAAANPTVVTDVPTRARHGHASWRRPLVALLAGGLTLGVLAGTAFAAQPGGLLYDARMWAETATLPAGGIDRAEAEVHRLEDRLAEAIRASAAGDGQALDAALAAYAAIVAEAGAGSAGDPAANAVIEAAVMPPCRDPDRPGPRSAAACPGGDPECARLEHQGPRRHRPRHPGGHRRKRRQWRDRGQRRDRRQWRDRGSGGTGGNGGGGMPVGPAATPTAKPPKPTPPADDKAPKPQATDHRPPNGPGGRTNPPASSARP